MLFPKPPIPIIMRHACYDNCKWRCDFDKNNEVFCHRVGFDLTNEQIEILKLVGCGAWKEKDKNEL